MAKDTFYFSHDYSGRNDPKLQKVLMKLGQAGKGVFWDLIEMLYEQDGYLLLSECESYAFALRTDCETINRLINDFDLFKKTSENFWSESVLRRLDQRDEKSKKASKSAKTRWDKANALKSDANAMRTQSDSNAIKERKGKERKEDVVVPSSTLFSLNNFEKEIEFGENEFTLHATRSTNKSIPELVEYRYQFIQECRGVAKLSWQNATDARKHFVNWVKKQPEVIIQRNRFLPGN